MFLSSITIFKLYFFRKANPENKVSRIESQKPCSFDELKGDFEIKREIGRGKYS